MGFQLVPKLVTLNNLEQHNGCYFALFHVIWWIMVVLGPIKSKWL